MDETTNSTNVDSNKKDKYLEDLKKGTPSVNGCCENIVDKDGSFEIAIFSDQVFKAKCDEIAKQFAQDMNNIRNIPSLVVHTVSREELEKIKTALKARQAAQEKAREAEKENTDPEK